jgi:hypothetical protein
MVRCVDDTLLDRADLVLRCDEYEDEVVEGVALLLRRIPAKEPRSGCHPLATAVMNEMSSSALLQLLDDARGGPADDDVDVEAALEDGATVTNAQLMLT